MSERSAAAQDQPRRKFLMSIQLNRVLDVFASFAIVALGLALAGATLAVAA
jgi:hypothetical protein